VTVTATEEASGEWQGRALPFLLYIYYNYHLLFVFLLVLHLGEDESGLEGAGVRAQKAPRRGEQEQLRHLAQSQVTSHKSQGMIERQGKPSK